MGKQYDWELERSDEAKSLLTRLTKGEDSRTFSGLLKIPWAISAGKLIDGLVLHLHL